MSDHTDLETEGETEGDDLPVLTQVLRIGSGRADASSGSAHGDASTDGATESPLDELLLDDQLVIGTEPPQVLEPYVPLTTAIAEPAAGDDGAFAESMTRSMTQSTTHPSIGPFVEPVDHEAFAARVREAVLDDLSARIDTEFDARIAQTLHAELEAALASLQDNLREQLAEAIRDVVRRAVDEQVARLRDTRGG